MDRLQDFAGEGRDVSETTADDAIVETPVVIGTDERRMHVRAYNHWVSLLDGRPYPSIDDLDLDSANDFSAHGVLLDFASSATEPAIAWLGDRLREECGLPAGVSTIADVPPRSLLSRLTDHHMQIIANRAPIGFEAEFVNTRGNNAMYRGILLPFSSDGETIDFIYGVINWKEVASEAVTQAVAAELKSGGPLVSKRPMAPVWSDGPNASAHHAASNDRASTAETENAAFVAPLPTPGANDALADWLAAARQTAEEALTADTRGRAALYRALGGAYDFALAAEARAEDYAALLADAKIKTQDRAPMTPVIKLIFGRGYDKTRVTEFAAALSFGRRRALPAGGMKLFLENFPGGLKAIVAAERRERRPAGQVPKPDVNRDAARALPVQAYLTLPGDDEFVVLVARRVDADRVAIIGVAPDDKPLVDRALRHIMG